MLRVARSPMGRKPLSFGGIIGNRFAARRCLNVETGKTQPTNKKHIVRISGRRQRFGNPLDLRSGGALAVIELGDEIGSLARARRGSRFRSKVNKSPQIGALASTP